MTVIGIIVAVVGIFIVLGLWLLFVTAAVSLISIYKKATVIDSVIVENLGNVKYSTGHVTVGVPKFRTFYKYKVLICINGEEHILETELVKRNLNPGEHVQVKYGIGVDDEISIISTSRIHWAMEMALGYTLGVVFAAVMVVLSIIGVI